MKRILAQYMLIFGSIIAINSSLSAQNIVGSWKRTASIIENTNGTRTDLQKNMLQAFPCAADIKYVFETGGRHYMILPKGCEAIPNSDAKWSQNGSTLTTSQKVGNQTITSTYEISVSGNTMTMTHTYTEAEKAKGSKDTKRIILNHQRL